MSDAHESIEFLDPADAFVAISTQIGTRVVGLVSKNRPQTFQELWEVYQIGEYDHHDADFDTVIKKIAESSNPDEVTRNLPYDEPTGAVLFAIPPSN